ncbi:SARP family transcriptional regulator [Streptomyces sp. RS10V-4]|uniref:AfsR/SARP family transcriptional regulator n=1 Tax=Streptomyces rhizoryzae TaxID=2932493 RepID=UPI002006BD44|nr:BTAD domain-containing putative transcriptional regulator [Streptomyces rhizoryzae]MCK7624282.1 SARP family transcriptional regulator [Streptomyces rhizoryzae]
MSRSIRTERGAVGGTGAGPLPAPGDTLYPAPHGAWYAPPRYAVPADGRPAPRRLPGGRARIEVLGGFRLVDGRATARLPAGSERLLAFVALHAGAVPRSVVAENLWPDAAECRAYASLRSALNRLRSAGCRVLDTGPAELALAAGVGVDFQELRPVAQALVEAVRAPRTAAAMSPGAWEIEGLSRDLLPGWCDEWALREAEEWRQLRMHALEALAARFISARRFAHAVWAAGAAVRAEPLRETARAALIRAHLAEGNQSEALREYQRYRALLQAELGLRPTARLRGLVAGLRAAGDRCAGGPADWREPLPGP